VSAHPQKVSGAKSANERQKAPSTNACSTKTEIVKCGAIQHSAKSEVFTISYFSLKSTDVTQPVSAKPSPFELIAFAGKLDQDRELIATV
jgi:hypothetical protein